MPRQTYHLFIPEHDDFADITFSSKKQAIVIAEWLCEHLPNVDRIHWYRDRRGAIPT